MHCTCIFRTCVFHYLRFQRPPPSYISGPAGVPFVRSVNASKLRAERKQPDVITARRRCVQRSSCRCSRHVRQEEEDRSASLVDTSSHQRKAVGHPLVLMSSTRPPAAGGVTRVFGARRRNSEVHPPQKNEGSKEPESKMLCSSETNA